MTCFDRFLPFSVDYQCERRLSAADLVIERTHDPPSDEGLGSFAIGRRGAGDTSI